MGGMVTSQSDRKSSPMRPWAHWLLGWLLLGVMAPDTAWGQSAVVETVEPQPRAMGEATPGTMESRLGAAPGTDQGVLGMQPGRDEQLMGRIGTAAPRAPSSISQPESGPGPRSRGIAAPEALPVPRSPLYGTLELPDGPESEGPPGESRSTTPSTGWSRRTSTCGQSLWKSPRLAPTCSPPAYAPTRSFTPTRN